MSATQSCTAHRNGNGVLKTEDYDVVIDGKIDANGNKLCSTSSDEEIASSTGSDYTKGDDETEDELLLKTRYMMVVLISFNRIKSRLIPSFIALSSD